MLSPPHFSARSLDYLSAQNLHVRTQKATKSAATSVNVVFVERFELTFQKSVAQSHSVYLEASPLLKN